ncbi:hypothetical protein CALCODRAFT_503230 [Calocera cornea HHB12733]|uniref:Uncharacterized protein n=1 Tax=Calocera cornea HHB12733 TaxID=1353952 RepID=A0A165CYZ7_9BASI|nr:hypothetical protein CALCODRAFT_503230 [Calocera cornea HHB12733]
MPQNWTIRGTPNSLRCFWQGMRHRLRWFIDTATLIPWRHDENPIIDLVDCSALPPPPDGTIELRRSPDSSSFKLIASLLPSDWESTAGRVTLPPPLPKQRTSSRSVTLHFTIRSAVTPCPGKGAVHYLHSVPVQPAGRNMGYRIQQPLTSVVVNNLPHETPYGTPLIWTATVEGTSAHSWHSPDGPFIADGFAVDLNGLVTITLTAA